MKRLVVGIVFSLSSFSSVAIAESECTCNPFPGNYPGVGLFQIPSKGWEGRLGLFQAKAPMNEGSLDQAMQQCRDLYQILHLKGVCQGELLINTEKGE
jgi:hypothetical protein